MNIFYRLYCRGYQMTLRALLPILPYREPKILKNNTEVAKVLTEKGKQQALLVTDAEIRKLGLTRPLEQELRKAGIGVVVYDGVVANPTTKNVAEALAQYRKFGCDCLIAFGGGSAMDCAKATGAKVARPQKSLGKMAGILKVRRPIPLLVAVPTTAGTGSETTLAAVITDSETRHKYAINDFPLIPRYALLDPKLTEKLPKQLTATTGMDALTHAIEAYIGRSTTKMTRKAALKAIKLIFENLEAAYHDGENLTARKQMLRAAYLAGLAFTQSYVGYVHAVAHSLGGKYNLPHGLVNAVILPVVLQAYGDKIDHKLWQIAVYVGLARKATPKAVAAQKLIEKIDAMNEAMRIPASLPEIQAKDIPQLARTAAKEANPLYPVPVLWTAEQLERIYWEVKGAR